ncbi:MAG TPA: M20/M25/M40 family metallo-hydrolase [Phycisphaerales bacterium]|nr:M20/M25/M40 family metallo-hydrolase [Phycisphaerales bacterium]
MQKVWTAALVCVLAGAAVAGPEEKVEQERLMATLRSLPTARAALGDAASREGLKKTEEQLIAALKELGYTPKVHEFKWALPARRFNREAGEEPAKPEEHTYRNISVEIVGKELPGEVLIVAAHFDAVPGTPGADDNGSGTAGLLELARVLKDEPMKRTVRLVFFNLEEVGLVGASQYVKELRERGVIGKKESGEQGAESGKAESGERKAEEGPAAQEGKGAAADAKPKEKIIGMISLESIGYFSDEPGSQKSPIPPIKGVFEPPTVGDGIALVGFQRDAAFVKALEKGMTGAAKELKVNAYAFPMALPDLLRSDHAPFYGAGVPAVMLTDTANFRNPNYHKPTDTVETIDPRRFTLVVKGVAGAVVEVAGECGQGNP